jgi:hypothetical protein
MSSGDGISEKSAFYVRYVSHEYDLLNALGSWNRRRAKSYNQFG